MKKKIIVAVDGTAGSGKTVTFQEVAKQVGYEFIDTGLMYRAFTLLCIEKKVDFLNQKEITAKLKDFDFTVINNLPYLNGKEVYKRLQANDIIKYINFLTPLSQVREFMVNAQRSMIKGGGYIELGRDITSVVLPNADLKIYLDSSIEVRAQRRYEQNIIIGINDNDLKIIKKSIINRDEQDKKNVLQIVEGVWYIDNSYLSIAQVIKMVVKKIKELEAR